MYETALLLIDLNRLTVLKKILIRNFLKSVDSTVAAFRLEDIIKLTPDVVNRQQFVSNVQRNLTRNNRDLRESEFNLTK